MIKSHTLHSHSIPFLSIHRSVGRQHSLFKQLRQFSWPSPHYTSKNKILSCAPTHTCQLATLGEKACQALPKATRGCRSVGVSNHGCTVLCSSIQLYAYPHLVPHMWEEGLHVEFVQSQYFCSGMVGIQIFFVEYYNGCAMV